jgi:DNA-binding beta-propeller fold protein YncE
MVSTVRARTLVLAAGLLPALATACSGSHSAQDPRAPAPQVNVRAPENESRPTHLHELSSGSLPAPVQDAAAAALGRNRVLLLGGLNSADGSTDTLALVSGRRASLLGRLPAALHDAAAVSLGRDVYLFGGGNGLRQVDAILRVDPRSGASVPAGRLPAPSSDQSAAAIGQTAYVVGGYTGTAWLNTIVAYHPGAGARVVGRLPTPVRYAAVAAADGRIVIAGGSLPNGTASRAVFSFDPSTGRVKRLGKLPAPTTHAAAAVVGDDVFVIGGRGAARDTPTNRIIEVEPSGPVRLSGHLLTARSDAAAVALGDSILVAGGRVAGSATANLGTLVVGRARGHPKRVGIPAAIDRSNVYAADGAGMLSPVVRHDPPYVYVPNSQSATVDVVDQRTFRIVRHFAVGILPQHVVPSYDLKTLYVTNDVGNSLTPIDPRTGVPGKAIPVDDPYNMYFTPDGRYAIVVAERMQRLDFRDAHTFELHKSLHVPECWGVDHIDFSADGSYLIASCEFSGRMIKVDVQREEVVATIDLPPGSMPQDVKLSPDGRTFYVADTRANGVWKLEGEPFRKVGFVHTGGGAHGLYPSRDARYLYVTNRSEGSISVLSFRTQSVVATWRIGGTPDMGGVSADGKVLWVTGRYSGALYAVSTRTGRLLRSIPVGAGPHGACVWPQPGRYSLGHTGILR